MFFLRLSADGEHMVDLERRDEVGSFRQHFTGHASERGQDTGMAGRYIGYTGPERDDDGEGGDHSEEGFAFGCAGIDDLSYRMLELHEVLLI